MTDQVIQVAGVHDLDEALLAIDGGANWLGIPLRLPSGKDDISESDAKDLIRRLPAGVTPVLISYMTDAGELAEFADEIGFEAVQLHGDITVAEVARLKELRPDLYVLKSLVVTGDNEAELLRMQSEMDPFVDMYLTDTYSPVTGAKGATGQRHDWSTSKALVENTERPLIIAGGLNPMNIADAIREIRPFGVDAHTGLEGADGRKSPELVAAFARNAREAFTELDRVLESERA